MAEWSGPSLRGDQGPAAGTPRASTAPAQAPWCPLSPEEPGVDQSAFLSDAIVSVRSLEKEHSGNRGVLKGAFVKNSWLDFP